MRRSLVLTDETARHPFRAIQPRRRALFGDDRQQSLWQISRADVRGVATTYFATLAAVLAFII